ncbi:MAG: TonB C-terminal domain-containing protein [Deltaproteobacteria bacterium]|jgi:outer membrane biosynthesis protein TonB|nr:TonB C-terminal domain-containing protein [Deltaproteobacteria bacterium]
MKISNPFLKKNFNHLLSGSITIILHLIAGFLLANSVAGSTPVTEAKKPEKPLPVSLVSPEINPPVQEVKVAKKTKLNKKTRKTRTSKTKKHQVVKKDGANELEKKEDEKEEKIDDSGVDCSLFDEASCSPCLAAPEVCKVCCKIEEKKEVKESTRTITNQSTCENPPCDKKDPCTSEALAIMSSSFCPKVRSSVYSRLGRITLRGVGNNKFLAARISVSVSSTGSISLSSFLKSSGNGKFDAAIRKAVKGASRVLPPTKITACVTTRGCIFNVTIGARKVDNSKSTIKLDNKKPDSNKDKNKKSTEGKTSGKDKS